MCPATSSWRQEELDKSAPQDPDPEPLTKCLLLSLPPADSWLVPGKRFYRLHDKAAAACHPSNQCPGQEGGLMLCVSAARLSPLPQRSSELIEM